MEHISDQMADIAHSIIEIYEDENVNKEKDDIRVV
jgi:phosphate:Na+ symporter